MSTTFIWGQGGVGKSHLAVRKVARAEAPAMLITMDPSLRIFDLLHLSNPSLEELVQLEEFSFTVKKTDEHKLFRQLTEKKSANPRVQVFFEQMVKGLQDFRDYLSLIQLTDELQNKNFKTMIVDTPPFQEAIGLHRSIFNLKSFFEKTLVQLTLKSTSMPWMHAAAKKLFEATRIFVGKKAADQAFDFLEWLAFHSERFNRSALFLEDLISSSETAHCFVITPETPAYFFEELSEFFKSTQKVEFVMNRSVSDFILPESSEAFVSEFKKLQTKEAEVMKALRRYFPRPSIEKIPSLLMGTDSKEEMLKFIRL